MMYSTEKLVKENEASFQANDISTVKEIIEEGRKAVANKDSNADDLKGILERLTNLSHKLSNELYSKKGAEGGAAPGADVGQQQQAGADAGAQGKGGDDVIEADFKDVP